MSWVREVPARHPRLGLALKGAVAAVLSWSLLLPVGGVAADYPYYAPLGAVVVVSTAVAASVRRGLQTIAALVLGAATATVTAALPVPVAVSLPLVVAVGIGLAGWRALGEAASWVPVAALFVLVVGAGDVEHYVLGYVGLTSVGIVVGTVVNALAPQLLLTPAHLAQARLRAALADELDELADRLDAQQPPDREQWRARQEQLEPLAGDARTLVGSAIEASRGNWRAPAWRGSTRQAYDEAQALVRVTTLLAELADLIAERDSPDVEDPALGPALRPAVARALTATARVLRHRPSDDDGGEDCSCRAEARAVLDDLERQVHTSAQRSDSGLWGAASVVTSLQRILAGLEPSPDAMRRVRHGNPIA